MEWEDDRNEGSLLLLSVVFVAVVVVIGLVVLFLPGYAGYAPEDLDRSSSSVSDTVSSVEESEVEGEFIEIVNKKREEKGVNSVSNRNELSNIGKEHAEEMEEMGEVSQEDSEGKGSEQRYRERGLLPACHIQITENQHYPGVELVFHHPDITSVQSSQEGRYRVSSAEDLAYYLYEQISQTKTGRMIVYHPEVKSVGLGISLDSGSAYIAVEFCGS